MSALRMTTLQDANLGITTTVAERLTEMNARHRAERHAAYGALNSLMTGAFLLAVFTATIFVWAAQHHA